MRITALELRRKTLTCSGEIAMARGLLARIGAAERHPKIDELESITEHLRVLLNTRQGDVPLAPELGIVHFVDLVHSFPEAAAVLQRSIRKTILDHEPRLCNVRVRQLDHDDPLVLLFEITARLSADPKGAAIRLRTHVSPGGVDFS
ncbi:MAG: type VI secretion system baseplate subunit TssE [Nannocystaceae bacterium]